MVTFAFSPATKNFAILMALAVERVGLLAV